MKILFRGKDNNFEWIDVMYKNGNFTSLDGKTCYNSTSIYSIKDDDRDKIVICSSCGKEVKNTPAAIKAHKDIIHDPNRCFGCSNLRPKNATLVSQKYVLNEDGTYHETTKRSVELTCGNSYRYPDIKSNEAQMVCVYSQCNNATFNVVSDFWTKYPGVFDEFITIDRIAETGYQNMFKYDTTINFQLKCRSKLIALVNNQGICYGFELRHHNNYYTLRYSKKYDKLFMEQSYGFRDFNRIDIADSTKDSIINKMRNLYN